MRMVPQTKITARKRIPAAWLYLLGLALLLYVVVPQFDSFRRSLPLLGSINIGWLLVAVAASLVAHTAAGIKYYVLALKPIRLGASVLVQFAGLLINRLVPAGIGGMGVSYDFLYKMHHSKVQAGVVVGVNDLLGLVGHVIVVVCLVLLEPSASQAVRFHLNYGVLAAAVVLAGVLAVLVLTHRRKLAGLERGLHKSLWHYRSHPRRLVQGTGGSAVIAAAYGLCLWAGAQALHTPVSFVAALIVLTLGVAAGSVTPTPGGLLGTEAALAVGLVAYGLTAAQALAVTLLYRFITYWFALALGGVALVAARRRGYV